MADYLRLRQICLAAPRLAPVAADLEEIFGIRVCYRDGNVAKYGLENALLMVGTNFLEVVAPTQDNTAGGRFIERTKGHGGYMAIFQASDVRRRQTHAEGMGVRAAHVIDRDTYKNVQLHPRDCRAAFIEFGHSVGGDDRMGTWSPAGYKWKDFVKTDTTKRMLGIEVESPQPDDLAAHWSKIIEAPLSRDRGDPLLTFEDGTIRFVKGESECLGAILVEVADVAKTLSRAVNCGYRVEGDFLPSRRRIFPGARSKLSGKRDEAGWGLASDELRNTVDGRMAFYLKAKAKAKYLITAQADTTERDIEHLLDGFTRADSRDVFRRLDPDQFYPSYGDDSTTYRDVDTMGRFYLRVDWDKNQALWGNYATGLTGTDYAQYMRSLYGAALNWRSHGINAWGDPSTELRAFGSDAETAPGHDEFVGTGGSLYYLKHTDILPGSDAVVLEVRDLATGRIENRVPLLRGADYELDEFQGRMLLTRALAQFTRENIPTLTRDTPLDGFEQRLVVDYEWQTSGLDSGELTTGVRGKQWFGDHVGVGLTYVDENRAGDDYSIVGSDLTLQAGKATYLKAEYVRTELATSPVFFSDNGGFTFTQISAAGPLEGDARSLEARANLKELGWTDQEWATGAWWRDTSTGFSVSRYSTGEPVTEIGAEILGNFAPNLRSYARYTRAESGADALIQTQATLEWRMGDLDTLSGEVRRVEQEAALAEATGVLGALKYTRRFGTALDLYGLAQLTLDDNDDRYPSNDAFAVGANYLFGEQYSMGSEISSGDRGDAATINAEYRLSPEHAIYGARTYSTDTTQYQSLFDPNRQNGWTLGQRWRLSNQVNLFNESQFLKKPDQSGLAHTFGMDFFPARGWNLGIALQEGGLSRIAAGNVERRAVSLTSGRRSPDTDWQSKLEWRQDSGAERREQWVTTHRLTRKINESWRIAARFNFSRTEDQIDPASGAKFVEGNFGFSWRPWNSTRWGAFGRYTYLYDLATLDQASGAQYDQRSQILSLEGVYRHGPRWEYAGKLARREGDVRFGRGAGEWADSAATLAAIQVRFELRMKWHALAESRWLSVDHGGTRQGFLMGLDRDINQHLRLGVGYNFTEFSDDLTDFAYDHRGAFINLVGMY